MIAIEPRDINRMALRAQEEADGAQAWEAAEETARPSDAQALLELVRQLFADALTLGLIKSTRRWAEDQEDRRRSFPRPDPRGVAAQARAADDCL